MMKQKNSLIIWLMLISGSVMSQSYNNYGYVRKLTNIDNQWHSLKVPNDVFSKINTSFSDLRIIGIKADGDTIEAPYILKVDSDKFNSESVKFDLINQVKNSEGYFYTFKIPDNRSVNYINIDFNRSNFDWLVKLEGSHNQQEWFSILDKSRVLSIENNFASYNHSSLTFANAKFNYFRLYVPSTVNPKLDNVSIKETSFVRGEYSEAPILLTQVKEIDNGSKTEIDIELKEAFPISFVKIEVKDSIDYYRPITIQYTIDSLENNTGWHYVYRTIHSTTLSSLGTNEFRFSNTVMKTLKILIDNGDNEPLNFQVLNVRGDVHQLVARFNIKATYYMLYGNKQASMPKYDISRFKTNIPENLTQISMGDEMEINIKENGVDDALIKDDVWLWAIMIIVIFILGWFAVRMLKE